MMKKISLMLVTAVFIFCFSTTIFAAATMTDLRIFTLENGDKQVCEELLAEILLLEKVDCAQFQELIKDTLNSAIYHKSPVVVQWILCNEKAQQVLTKELVCEALHAAAFYGSNRGKNVLNLLLDEPASRRFITSAAVVKALKCAVALRQFEAVRLFLSRNDVRALIDTQTLLGIAAKVRSGNHSGVIQGIFIAEFRRRGVDCYYSD